MPRNRRAEMLDAAPIAEQAITSLRSRGAVHQADAVQTVLDYARDAAAARERKAASDAKLDQTLSLHMDKALRDHIKAVAAEGETSRIITDRFREFLAGEWTPEPAPRAPYGQTPPKASYNPRAPKDLIERVEKDLADPDVIAELGWDPRNARQVAIAALREAFPLPAAD